MVSELDPPTLLTVGAAAIPVKSPANLIFPFVVVVASGVDCVIALSTKSLTAFADGYLVSEVPSALTSKVLFTASSLYPNRVINVAVSAIKAATFASLSIIEALYTANMLKVSFFNK